MRSHGRIRILHASHDLQLDVLEVALTLRQALQLVLQRLRFFGVRGCREAIRIACAALFYELDVGFEPRQLGAGIITRAGERRELAQLILTNGDEFGDARRLGRLRACAFSLRDAAVKVGDVEQDSLVFRTGVHAVKSSRCTVASVHIPVDVVPAAILAHEAAAFSHRPALCALSPERLELHDAVIVKRPATLCLDDVQARPVHLWIKRRIHRAGRRMPRAHQVAGVAPSEGREARAHEPFSGRRGATLQDRAAAHIEWVAGKTGTAHASIVDDRDDATNVVLPSENQRSSATAARSVSAERRSSASSAVENGVFRTGTAPVALTIDGTESAIPSIP